MPRREMSKEEHDNQQWTYRVKLMPPQDMQDSFKNKTAKDPMEEDRRKKLDELQAKLLGLIREKFNTCLTKRQQEVIDLYLISKKQEHMGSILSITQEAVHSRLNIAFARLRKACAKDPKIQEVLKEIKLS
jgi:DNA-directed RNA polymerase specialized sigma24 family protein